jgi:hypothetical protein
VIIAVVLFVSLLIAGTYNGRTNKDAEAKQTLDSIDVDEPIPDYTLDGTGGQK